MLRLIKEARKGFFGCYSVCETMKDIPKKDISWCRQTINIFATLLLGNTLRAFMTSYWLPRRHARSTKRPSKLQLLKIIGKTKSVTYRFYFFVGNLLKFFNLLESMTKSYVVEFKMQRKMTYYSLQKIALDKFPRNFFIVKCHRE